MYRAWAAVIHLKRELIGVVKGELFNGFRLLEMGTRERAVQGRDDVITKLLQLYAVVAVGHGAGGSCGFGGKHGISLDRGAVHHAVQVKPERLTAV